jgi:hypothetical protein
MMLLSQQQHEDRELEVVKDLYLNPVTTFRRNDLPIYTNVNVNGYFNKFSTYYMRELILKEMPTLNIGVASYLAQCMVNPMSEAHYETRCNVCDLTCAFGNDFRASDGTVYTAEEIQGALFGFFNVTEVDKKHVNMSYNNTAVYKDRALEVVKDFSENPVVAIRRDDLPTYTNVNVDDYFDKFSTYYMRDLILKEMPTLNIGVASYLAQCMVNPMLEAHYETRCNVCDLTCAFGYDFRASDGTVYTAEEIHKALFKFFDVTEVDKKHVDMAFNITIE